MVQEIMNYQGKFLRLKNAFSHCKNEEKFISELEISYPEHKYKLDRTYCYGRGLSEELAFEIGNINNKELHPTLKAMIENISRELISREKWKTIADEVRQYYELHNINIWSLDYMDSRYREIF
ncbi:hypothetical protein SFB21_0754 [Acinetobacter bouvetii]|uniref:Uncharacterized protein n=2 Tax=Acinetobacter bouvetii TaxID=202951 RepID=A0A811G978_9GAMM|nr:hypothetical protein SFB21_0754 [Acinetobacter bouvetii]